MVFMTNVRSIINEGKRRYNTKLWKLFTDLFNNLPIAALIDEKIFCVHGGLSPDLNLLEQINTIVRPTEVPNNGKIIFYKGLLCDLLWSDPSIDCDNWNENDRGVSYIFSKENVKNFLEKNNLDLICRAHQVFNFYKLLFTLITKIVEDGYEFFADRTLVTIFSAPDYCGEFNNSAAMMIIDENLICCFKVLKPELDETKELYKDLI